MKWFLKISLKIIISRLPIPYEFWKSIGFFKHGSMDSCEYAIKIFNLHFKRAFPEHVPSSLKILELGPGDSIASAIIGYSYGVSKTFLVDIDNFATQDINFYKRLAILLKSKGLNPPDLSHVSSFNQLLHTSNAIYLPSGLTSLKSIEDNSIDYIWSHSVLEHVRKHEFFEVIKELRRITKYNGLNSHNIDFQDHLDYSLNNLRFGEKIWESSLFVRSGFYTNRIPAVKIHSIFRKIGFSVKKESFGKWPQLPIKRSKIHKDFDSYNDSELLNRTSYILLKKELK